MALCRDSWCAGLSGWGGEYLPLGTHHAGASSRFEYAPRGTRRVLCRRRADGGGRPYQRFRTYGHGGISARRRVASATDDLYPRPRYGTGVTFRTGPAGRRQQGGDGRRPDVRRGDVQSGRPLVYGLWLPEQEAHAGIGLELDSG